MIKRSSINKVKDILNIVSFILMVSITILTFPIWIGLLIGWEIGLGISKILKHILRYLNYFFKFIENKIVIEN